MLSESKMRRILRAHKKSGLSLKDFAKKRGICSGLIHYYRKRLKKIAKARYAEKGQAMMGAEENLRPEKPRPAFNYEITIKFYNENLPDVLKALGVS